MADFDFDNMMNSDSNDELLSLFDEAGDEGAESFDFSDFDIDEDSDDKASFDAEDDSADTVESFISTGDFDDMFTESDDATNEFVLGDMSEEAGELGEVSKNVLEHKSSRREDFDIDDMYVSHSTGLSGLLENKTDSSAFEFTRIPIKNITATTNRIRKTYNLDKLVLSIQNEGLLCPIVVAPTKTEGVYVLVDGLRRMLACAKVGISEIPCIINNNVSIPEISIVEALSNQTKNYTVQEMLDYIEYIKKEKGVQSSTIIEHLLNMDAGDYNKLMDVIEDDDPEIVGPLLGGQMSIQMAFKKLEQKRKKLGKEGQDNARANKIYSNLEEYGMDRVKDSGEISDSTSMSDDEVKNIVNSIGNIDDIDGEDGESLRSEGDSIQGFQPHKQDPNDRERLDPKLRKSVLARDNNTCMICEQISGQEYTEVLDVHHIVEVYLGGNDDIDNLVTACTCCHKLIHLWGRGELQVRPFEEMDALEARKFKRIIKLGNVIRTGMTARGMKRDELKKMDKADTIGRRLKGSSDQVAG